MFGQSEAGQELDLSNKLSTVPHKIILKVSTWTACSLGLKVVEHKSGQLSLR